MKLWQAGATLSAALTLCGLVGMGLFGLDSTKLGVPPDESFEFDDYTAWWGRDELLCQEYDSCVFVVIQPRADCAEATVVEFTVTSENDLYLSTQRLVVQDALIDKQVPVEIGSDTSGVGYFALDNITCSSLVETVERSV